MVNKRRVGILGGAFDPIHQGHLQLAQYALEKVALDEVRFVPCQLPVLKPSTQAKPWQRAAMVALAITNQKKFILDTREIERKTPSYALLTLQSLQQQFPDVEFFWLLGADAFANFDQWYQWRSLADHCHLVVVAREHIAVTSEQRTKEINQVFHDAKRQIIYLDMPLHAAASRIIRQNIHQHLIDLPLAVQQYIEESGLYQ